jgi:hypothetical protein
VTAPLLSFAAVTALGFSWAVQTLLRPRPPAATAVAPPMARKSASDAATLAYVRRFRIEFTTAPSGPPLRPERMDETGRPSEHPEAE